MAKRTRLTAMEAYATKSRKSEPIGARGSGTLLLERKASGAIMAFYRERAGDKEMRLALGSLSKNPTPETDERDLNGLRAEAARISHQVAQAGGIAKYLALEAERAAARAEEERARRRAAELARARGTFGEMLQAYSDHLFAEGKASAQKVQSLFRVNVSERRPELAACFANEISPEDIKSILDDVLSRTPKPRGIGNKALAPLSDMRSTADELRRYLKTAFNFAAAIHLMPGPRDGTPQKNFCITSNPAALIPPIGGVGGGSTRSLSQAEFGALLRYLDNLPEKQAAIANSLIYFGGQRIKQLMALTWEHVTEETICLLDSKGRKKEVWEHLLPWTPRLKEIMAPLLSDNTGPGPYCLMPGKSAHEDTVSHLFTKAGQVLSEQGMTLPFSWKEVRATVETMLAALGINEQTRAWLLSHGRQGVQAKHYDRYAYLPEKRAALEKWGSYLDELRAGRVTENVVLVGRRLTPAKE